MQPTIAKFKMSHLLLIANYCAEHGIRVVFESEGDSLTVETLKNPDFHFSQINSRITIAEAVGLGEKIVFPVFKFTFSGFMYGGGKSTGITSVFGYSEIGARKLLYSGIDANKLKIFNFDYLVLVSKTPFNV